MIASAVKSRVQTVEAWTWQPAKAIKETTIFLWFFAWKALGVHCKQIRIAHLQQLLANDTYRGKHSLRSSFDAVTALFERRMEECRDGVLPPGVTARIAQLQASTFGWNDIPAPRP